MTKIFGTFRENIPKTYHEYLELGFSPTSLSVQQRWRNNGLSADFVADYLTTFLPVFDTNGQHTEQQIEIKGAINYIANELLENAMKFNHEPSEEPIKFSLHLLPGTPANIVLSVSNGLSPTGCHKLQDFIQDFLTSDPEEFYIRQLEKSVAEETSSGSGMGFITIRNDYQAQLGWKFTLSEYQAENFT
ncbi:MAG: ATP-binding protein, partial [Cyanobacteria bacterium J06642_11]